MRPSLKAFGAIAAAAIVVAGSTSPLLARGGAPSIMDSPGYQRRLQESRQQLAEPIVHSPLAHSHRHTRPHH